MNYISEEDKIQIKKQQQKNGAYIGIRKRYDSHDEYNMWFCNDYLIHYKSKEKFDDAIEEIEMKKNANKYNL